MSREKIDFRDNLERIDEKFPGKEILTIKDVQTFTGVSRNTVRKWFFEDGSTRISKVTLARLLSR